MKILICGGAGFIGGHLANYLKSRGNYVRVVDIKPREKSYQHLNIDEYDKYDLTEFPFALNVCRDIDYVYQLASNMGGIGWITEYGAPIMRDNSRININMLEACRATSVKRIFFSSSACIYNRLLQATPANLGLKEGRDDYPSWPDSAYGWEKLYAEILYENYRHECGINVRIARFHNIMGKYCPWDGGQEKAPAALCRKVAQAKDGDVIKIWGDGRQSRSYTYIDDCIKGINLIMNSDYYKPVNIGTTELVTVDQLANMIIDISGKHLKIEHELDKPQGVRGRNCDNTLVKELFDWEPNTPLKQGLKVVYDWVSSKVKERGY